MSDPEAGSASLQNVKDLQRIASRNDELEGVLGAAGVGFCRVDCKLSISATNPHFSTLFGHAPDDSLQWTDIEAALTSDDRGKPAAAIAAAVEHGESAEITVKTVLSEHAPAWLSLRVSPLVDDAGVRSQVLLIARDATAQHRALVALSEINARERSARIAADGANRAKDEFLSVISHELRSPLNAILGWNRILAIKRSEDMETKSISTRIEHSAKSQLKMVNDLLDLGRIGTGKLRITPRQMKLATLIGVTVDAVRPAAAAKGVEITVETEGQRSVVHGDPDRLSQVVSNLLSNALKFTPAGGKISVRLRDFDGRAELSVIDTGQGIAPDLLPHIFDRFRQGDSSTTRGAGGLGLGLTLVREIVALHGGSVSAASDGDHHGSTFVITLPTIEDAEHAGERKPKRPLEPRPEHLTGLSILVVDDEADARAVVAETLRLEGARVTVGDSVQAALAHLRAPGAKFDVMVTDIGMPEEDGYSLCRKLRRLTDGGRVVAIALTGYVSHADVEAAIDAGFDLHVPKPVDFDSFVPIIRRLADAR